MSLSEAATSNAKQREKIIESLNKYTSEYSGKWPGLIDMTKYLSKTFQSWQKFAPVLDEDFSKLKSEFYLSREPINDAIKDQENKNYKIKESLIPHKTLEIITFIASKKGTAISHTAVTGAILLSWRLLK